MLTHVVVFRLLFDLEDNFNGKPLEIFLGLAHAYKMAGHVAHGDEMGVNIIEEKIPHPQVFSLIQFNLP